MRGGKREKGRRGKKRGGGTDTEEGGSREIESRKQVKRGVGDADLLRCS